MKKYFNKKNTKRLLLLGLVKKLFYLIIFLITHYSCSQTMENKHAHTNALINETSPYLLQHAHNPVNWMPWGDEALQKAKDENKLMIISIGYSACHWCHVMEHESFEDSTVAQVMNNNFICIKVDREERPDVDQVYINAVQLMTGQGGWPLNCIALPDGRPVWGGTYFGKEDWINSLQQIADFYKNTPEKMEEYATKLTEGVQKMDMVVPASNEPNFSLDTLDLAVGKWAAYFDNEDGGPKKAPKFPLPNNYQFLMRYAHLTENKNIEEHVQLTLKKMAYGGIYDQVGGGFARYSVDGFWKVPHFEKMLYDNAQLVSLYSEAYTAYKNPLYKDIVYQTLDFIEREMTTDEGAFYSALDADSEGEEGKFYVWTKEELKSIIPEEDFLLFADYYNINKLGYWEHDNYILLHNEEDEVIAKKHGISIDKLQEKVKTWQQALLSERSKRVRPGLDDKCLTSWNGMMLKGYADAYQAFNEEDFLQTAIKNANYILSKQLRTDGGLNHTYKEGKSTINGYLEDYAFTIDGLIALYQATFDEKWLQQAQKLTDYTLTHFYDDEVGMFYFTSDEGSQLIARNMEVTDNVTPASNSQMARNLFALSHYFGKEKYNTIATRMLNNIAGRITDHGSGYSNWGMLWLNHSMPFYELVINGTKAHDKRIELNNTYTPNILLAGSTTRSSLPLLQERFKENNTYIYVCVNKACQLPVNNVDEALRQIK